MIALEVTADGKRVCLAGAGEDGVMTVGVCWVGSSAENGSFDLHVGGLDSTTDEHLVWDVPEIAVGSTVVVRVVEVAQVDEPKSRTRNDPGAKAGRYGDIVRRVGEGLPSDERKQLLRELIAELEALG